MEFLGFVFNVWASIAFGLFTILMVFGCTFDRRGDESLKWWTALIGVIALGVWQKDAIWPLSLDTFLNLTIWSTIGYYLLAGAGYSLIEFFGFTLREQKRSWSSKWEHFKKTYTVRENEILSREFVSRYGGQQNSIFNVELASFGDDIQPKINRGELAEHIGVWILFWPFYALSRIIGNLLAEIWYAAADFFVAISGRLVKTMFKDVFK